MRAKLVILLVCVSCALNAQKTKTIKLNAKKKFEQVYLTNGNYVLIFNKAHVLEPYYRSAAYDSLYSVLNSDTVDFRETYLKVESVFKSMNLHFEFYKDLRKMIDKGQMRVYDRKNKTYLKKIKCETDDRLRGSAGVFFTYKNPSTDEVIVEMAEAFIGAPNF